MKHFTESISDAVSYTVMLVSLVATHWGRIAGLELRMLNEINDCKVEFG